ncbi:NFU domain protein 1 [Hibiscus syriacus]|uniref:NFU domain protein 1 n=1 Tax=Hibiscus syriacus TaxID=106335 RepID=A0A6A3AYZ8_HIBSY|nr:NFU domain protein 1 [Hibiscus syriacus]
MVNPGTNADPLQQQQPPFIKGTPVEVSSDDEGFRGAWYSAIILEPLKSTSKKRKKALVRYKTLLADDGSSPLTEYVDPSYIRPLPPNEKGSAQQFEVNDVVDASYRDGWWTGVEYLRVHWNWIDGKWVRPEKQQSTGSIFSSGTAVEVNIDNENLGDIWYPVLVVKENEDNTFLVKCQNSSTHDECGTVKVVVDSLHIRPIPPRYADRNYELLERVDATYNFGWRSGVITKVLTGKRYNVFFKHGNEDKEFCHSDIRPNVEWVDGKWFSKFKEVIIASDEQEQIAIALGTQNSKKSTSTDENNALNTSRKKVKPETSNGYTSRSWPSKKLTEGSAVETPISAAGNKLKDIPSETLCKEGTPRTGGKGAKSSKKAVVGDEHCAKIESPTTEAINTTKRQKAGSSDGTANDLVQRNVRARKSPIKGPQVPTAGKDGTTRIAEANKGEIKTKEAEMAIVIGLTAFTKSISNVNDSARNQNMETKEHKVGANDLKRKTGRPDRSVVTSPKASDAATEDSRGRTSDDYKTKEVHTVAPGISDLADEDQPLSTWIGGMHTSGDEESRLPSARLLNGWNGEKGLVDVPIESLEIDASGRSPLVNDQGLPFVKRSTVWRTIESMDVFRVVPQKPHFLPLAENREEFREGSAIGIMVSFASLFEKISTLHFDEPRDTFDSILESLSDLEKHGFDVTLLQHRLDKLLSLKERHNQHLEEMQNAEREMIENTKEISKFDEEMEEIEKKITQLQERHASIKSEKETKNLKVGSLKFHVSALNKLIQNASHDFKKIATASWKLP